MILAAGLGTRLRPLTDNVPKALVPVGGIPMLERVALRLVEAGADRLIVNVSHHADRIRAYVEARGGFGVETLLSEEPDGPLETGGGLARAAPLFRRENPFLLHNVDVLTDADLTRLLEAHAASAGALATLLAAEARSPRYLLFDDHGLLGCALPGGERTFRSASGTPRRLDFLGVHAVSPRIFEVLDGQGVFSIMDVYLRLAGAGERILAHPAGAALWVDVGTPEGLAEAERALAEGGT